MKILLVEDFWMVLDRRCRIVVAVPNAARATAMRSLRMHRLAMTVTLLLVLALQSLNLHAELIFRSLEQLNGPPRWSAIKKYSSPADTAYANRNASGALGHADEVRVFLSGEITRRDVDDAGVMAYLIASGKQKIAGNTLWLASKGGDIDAGMELGRLLRKWGIFTVVAKNDQCMSACVFAFMGGERRSVGGVLGIHRPYFPFTEDSADRPARFRHLEKTLKDFIEELDFPASLYEAVMLVPPESMQIVSPADLRKFYLEGASPLSEDRMDAAAARRLDISMFAYLQLKARTPACAVDDSGLGQCDGFMHEATPGANAAENAAKLPKGETATARASSRLLPEMRDRRASAAGMR